MKTAQNCQAPSFLSILDLPTSGLTPHFSPVISKGLDYRIVSPVLVGGMPAWKWEPARGQTQVILVGLRRSAHGGPGRVGAVSIPINDIGAASITRSAITSDHSALLVEFCAVEGWMQ